MPVNFFNVILACNSYKQKDPKSCECIFISCYGGTFSCESCKGDAVGGYIFIKKDWMQQLRKGKDLISVGWR